MCVVCGCVCVCVCVHVCVCVCMRVCVCVVSIIVKCLVWRMSTLEILFIIVTSQLPAVSLLVAEYKYYNWMENNLNKHLLRSQYK